MTAPGAITGVVAMVIGEAPDARAHTLASLARQSVQVSVLGPGQTLSSMRAVTLVMVRAGVALDVTACERFAWYLAAQPNAAWVTGGRYDRATVRHEQALVTAPSGMAPLEALLDVCAVRVGEARHVLGDALWSRAAHTGARTPGLQLQLLVALHSAGGRGGWIDPVLATPLDDDGAQVDADVARAEASLVALALDPSQLIEPRLSLPSLVPLQTLDTVAAPALSVSVPVATGHRVLALLQGFPMGGYTAFNADVLPRLVARGHHVTTACLEWWRSDWRLDQLRHVAPDIHHVPSVVPFGAMSAYLEHLIASRAIEVVLLSHSFLGYRLLARLRARFPQVAFVDYVHTEWFEQPMYGSYAAMSARWSEQLDAQITSSRALAAAVIAGGAATDRVHVAHIGIDTTVWTRDGIDRAEIRSAFGADDTTTVLLFAGRLSPEKRPMLALDAVEALRAEGRDVRLVVAGDGPMLRAVHDAVASRGLDADVSVLGEVDDHTLRQVYTAADVLFAPSEIEGIARTLYEGMAMGCVPVVSDVGGQRELVVAGTGSLVPPMPGTVAAYLPALRTWCDANTRRPASAAARAQIVAHFDSTHTVQAMEAALAGARAHARNRANGAAERAAPVSAAMAEELAVLGTEVARRHALAAATALASARRG